MGEMVHQCNLSLKVAGGQHKCVYATLSLSLYSPSFLFFLCFFPLSRSHGSSVPAGMVKSVSNFWSRRKYLNHYRMDCLEIWFRHSQFLLPLIHSSDYIQYWSVPSSISPLFSLFTVFFFPLFILLPSFQSLLTLNAW